MFSEVFFFLSLICIDIAHISFFSMAANSPKIFPLTFLLQKDYDLAF